MVSSNSYIKEHHKDYLSVLAYIYLENNQPEKAIKIYAALYYLFPESKEIAFCLSYLHLRIREFDTALFYADQYLSRKKTALGLLLKGQALYKLGRPMEARETMRNLLN